MQDLSDLWRDADAVNISGDFSPKEFAAALYHSKPGKAPGTDSICPELLIHVGPGFVGYVIHVGYVTSFLPACATSKLQKSGEERW